MPYHVYLPPLTLSPLGSLDRFKDVVFHPIPPPSLPVPDSTLRLPKTQIQTPPYLNESHSHLSSLGSVSLSLSASRPSQALANIPTWTIPFRKLVSLHDLLIRRQTRERPRVSMLCGVMSVEAPVSRQRRRAGPGGRMDDMWIASWDVLAPGNGEPAAAKVKLWDECARDWGGLVRKGDVILLEDVEFVAETFGPHREGPQFVLSPRNGRLPTKPLILFRTLPRYAATRADYVYRPGPRGLVPGAERGEIRAEDLALRPHLGLARSDRGVQAVAEMARWCADWVGGEGP